MAWDDEMDKGRIKRTIDVASGKVTVLLYRAVVGIMTTLCAALSGLIFSGFIDQGKQLATIVAMQPRIEQRIQTIETTVGSHSSQIDAATSQEKMDAAVLKNQVESILKKLDDFRGTLDGVQSSLNDTQQKLQSQDTKLTNLGIAVARVRGAQQSR